MLIYMISLITNEHEYTRTERFRVPYSKPELGMFFTKFCVFVFLMFILAWPRVCIIVILHVFVFVSILKIRVFSCL